MVCKHQTYCIVMSANERVKYLNMEVFFLLRSVNVNLRRCNKSGLRSATYKIVNFLTDPLLSPLVRQE